MSQGSQGSEFCVPGESMATRGAPARLRARGRGRQNPQVREKRPEALEGGPTPGRGPPPTRGLALVSIRAQALDATAKPRLMSLWGGEIKNTFYGSPFYGPPSYFKEILRLEEKKNLSVSSIVRLLCHDHYCSGYM